MRNRENFAVYLSSKNILDVSFTFVKLSTGIQSSSNYHYHKSYFNKERKLELEDML